MAYVLRLRWGGTKRVTLTWRQPDGTPYDLTGCTAAELQVRQTAVAADAYVSLSLGAGIELGGPAGTIDLLFTDEATQGLPRSSREKKAVTDLFVTFPNGDRLPVFDDPVPVAVVPSVSVVPAGP